MSNRILPFGTFFSQWIAICFIFEKFGWFFLNNSDIGNSCVNIKFFFFSWQLNLTQYLNLISFSMYPFLVCCWILRKRYQCHESESQNCGQQMIVEKFLLMTEIVRFCQWLSNVECRILHLHSLLQVNTNRKQKMRLLQKKETN